jgi:release factor glutamine methyltransferase
MSGKFDLIVSNPPYIKKSDIEKLAPEVSIYEPSLALDGGHDGLECYRRLAPGIANLLYKNSYAVVEFGRGQHDDVRLILENTGMEFIAFKSDLSHEPRCVVVKYSG